MNMQLRFVLQMTYFLSKNLNIFAKFCLTHLINTFMAYDFRTVLG